ncbi:MAG: hypothetical protein NXI10_14055 [bacterium]|nr:hypothetical protein [bacterium]
MINILTAPLLSLFLHAHHISVCEMTYKEDSKTLEITQQVFADDIELFIKRESGNETFDIRAEEDQVQKYLQNFIEKHIVINLDGTSLSQHWIAYKIDGNDVRFFIELKDVTGSQLSVTNTIFLEMLGGQVNVIHFHDKEERKTKVCSQEKKTVFFDL